MGRSTLIEGIVAGMLSRTSKYASECYARAADCRRRAQDAADPAMQTFWETQEVRWLQLAGSSDLSARISTFLDARSPRSTPAEDGVDILVDVFDRACQALELDLADETQPRKIARTIIQATMDGESDPEQLFLIAIKAVSN